MTTASKGTAWMLLPWGILGAALSGLAFMASLAARDPSFSLEQDYYRKATAWDDELAQRRENERLGWTLSPSPVRSGVELALHARGGEPLPGASGKVEAFAIARSQAVQEAPLREVGPGRYAADVRFSRSGLWELRVTVQRGADTFTQVLRLDAPREGGS